MSLSIEGGEKVLLAILSHGKAETARGLLETKPLFLWDCREPLLKRLNVFSRLKLVIGIVIQGIRDDQS